LCGSAQDPDDKKQERNAETMNTKWFYYVHNEGNAVAKVNTDAFEWRMGEIGFQPASYSEYLKQRKSIREREEDQSQIRIKKTVKGEDNGNN